LYGYGSRIFDVTAVLIHNKEIVVIRVSELEHRLFAPNAATVINIGNRNELIAQTRPLDLSLKTTQHVLYRTSKKISYHTPSIPGEIREDGALYDTSTGKIAPGEAGGAVTTNCFVHYENVTIDPTPSGYLIDGRLYSSKEIKQAIFKDKYGYTEKYLVLFESGKKPRIIAGVESMSGELHTYSSATHSATESRHIMKLKNRSKITIHGTEYTYNVSDHSLKPV